MSQVTALPSGSCALVWDSETEERTNHMAGQLQDPVGTLGRGISISPDLRRLLEAADHPLLFSLKIGHGAKFHVKVIYFKFLPECFPF